MGLKVILMIGHNFIAYKPLVRSGLDIYFRPGSQSVVAGGVFEPFVLLSA